MPRFILNCCFESLWVRLTTGTLNDWIQSLLLLIPYHMLKTNFITLAHSWDKAGLLPFITLGMSWHAWPHPLGATKQYLLLYGPLAVSEKLTSYLNLFVRYSSLKSPAFWLALRFSETYFFCKNLKDHWHFHAEAKIIHIWLDKIFAKTIKTMIFWYFLSSPSPSELLFKNQNL